MIGKTYAKPFSSLNPLPVAVDEKADFYLFQASLLGVVIIGRFLWIL